MAELLLQPTQLAQWHSLVNEAQLARSLELGEDLESYLVFLLMRFVGRPEMVMSIVATEFLHGIESQGRIRNDKLREVADKCLLFSGLFPGLAKRRRVTVKYYVDMGRNAYYYLAELTTLDISKLYRHVGNHFIILTDVLHAMRCREEQEPLSIQEHRFITKKPQH